MDRRKAEHGLRFTEEDRKKVFQKIKEQEAGNGDQPGGTLAARLKKAVPLSASIIVLILFAGLLLLTINESLFPQTGQAPSSEDEAWIEDIEELSFIWANALKERDGKPRYEMMSAEAKEKFIEEQKTVSGTDWNYVLCCSSPWVVEFEIERKDEHSVMITYLTQTSEPRYYRSVEVISFREENGRAVVDEYETVLEDEEVREAE